MKTDQNPCPAPSRSGAQVLHQTVSTVEFEPVTNHPGLAVITLNQPDKSRSFIVRESDREDFETMPDPFNLDSFRPKSPGRLPRPFSYFVFPDSVVDFTNDSIFEGKSDRDLLLSGEYDRSQVFHVSGWDHSVWHPDHDLPRTSRTSLELWGSRYDLEDALERLNDHDWVENAEIIPNPVGQNIDISGRELIEAELLPDQEALDTLNAGLVNSVAYEENIVTSKTISSQYMQTVYPTDPLGLRPTLIV